MKTSRTFRSWGSADVDRYVSKMEYEHRTKNKKRLKKSPEIQTAASFMRTEWDRRVASLYEGKPYRDPYGRKGSGKIVTNRNKKGTSI
jgi:hypothetical protein